MEQFLGFGENIFEDGLIFFAVRSLLIWIVSEIVVKMIRRSMKREETARSESTRTPVKFFGNVIITVVRSIATFLILSSIKPLSTVGRAVLGATSVIAVIVGLAAQEAFGNLIAGFFLAMYQPFRLGDLVKLSEKDLTGTVEELSLRHTVIRTFDGTRVVIPNSQMNSAIVENKRTENNLFSRQIIVSVAYDTDIDQARKVITDCVTGLKNYIDPRTEAERKNGQPPVNVVVTDFLDSGIELRFRVYTRTAAEAYEFGGQVREAVLKAFRENGIQIPYPVRMIKIIK